MKLKVTYIATMTQIIDWPDDELYDLNYDNLLVNLEPEESRLNDTDEIIDIKKLNGNRYEPFEF